ncbi:type VI secretion system protein TssL [Thiorhodococcus mannitoliphagus]|uniref:Type VI secretion system protein TssL n=1 Tax=Thiorhodococcus mannitoliphagus TaxID=329406 RepID=A0A6P1DZT6_9GAMM|nr:type VI secretion system protein TssL, long form [Thiorhodococcus mannitoliphagus]NEX23209.1 type VI secretion system protein TssL [Thiorhodococcus mannitoliphagus]
MEETECEQQECPAGAPEWVMTFADLMSLMMCFFVLLLSFSEMDVQKYKQVAGSMKFAFGVQREVKVADIPAGTSIITQEFSPAQPEPTLINEITQETIDQLKEYLKVEDTIADAEEKAEELREALKEEIEQGLLEISTIDDQVVIRIREQGSFASASDAVSTEFRDMLIKVGDALNRVEGKIIVAGHTDDIPIETREFPSNWVLSAARAAAVAHTMTEIGAVDQNRIEIRAYGENQPLESNETAEGRAKNRRVEIIVLSDRDPQSLIENLTLKLDEDEAKAQPDE